jgi:hypothetical protein
MGFCFLRVLGVSFFLNLIFKIFILVWFPHCIPCQFEIPFVLIILASTFEAAFWGMSKVLTFLLTSFLELAKLFYLCRCPPLLCFSLVLFLLLIRVGFGLNLTPLLGYLSFILCAFVCFIKSLEPSRMRSSKLFTNPLIELLETQQIS